MAPSKKQSGQPVGPKGAEASQAASSGPKPGKSTATKSGRVAPPPPAKAPAHAPPTRSVAAKAAEYEQR
eukprot:10376628-Lingulodinium_polyedra.AAC.1